jgi:hypothetical protein
MTIKMLGDLEQMQAIEVVGRVQVDHLHGSELFDGTARRQAGR